MKFNIRIMTNLGGMGSQEPYKESKTGGEEKESLIMLQEGEGFFQDQWMPGKNVLMYTVYPHLETWAGLESVF